MIDITHRILHDQQFTRWYGGFFKMRYPNSSLDDENIGQSQTQKWMKTGGKALFQETSIRQLQLLNISPFFSYVKPYWQSVSISMGLWAILHRKRPYIYHWFHIFMDLETAIRIAGFDMISHGGFFPMTKRSFLWIHLHLETSMWWIPWKLSQLYHHNYSILMIIW